MCFQARSVLCLDQVMSAAPLYNTDPYNYSNPARDADIPEMPAPAMIILR